jgi:hypothetical protein
MRDWGGMKARSVARGRETACKHANFYSVRDLGGIGAKPAVDCA